MNEPICQFDCRRCENNATADESHISCTAFASGVRGIIKPTEDGRIICTEFKEAEP